MNVYISGRMLKQFVSVEVFVRVFMAVNGLAIYTRASRRQGYFLRWVWCCAHVQSVDWVSGEFWGRVARRCIAVRWLDATGPRSCKSSAGVDLHVSHLISSYHPQMRRRNAFGRICLCVCLSVCNALTFKGWPKKFIFTAVRIPHCWQCRPLY